MGTLLHSGESGFGRAYSTFDPDDAGGTRKRSRTRGGKSSRRAGEKPRVQAFDRIIKLCSVRDRSVKELRDRLARDGYEAADIESAVERAVRCGLVDDARFARVFIRSRVSMGKGPVIIARDLKNHGIDLESVPGWPDDFSSTEDEQYDRAVAFLSSHPPRSKDQWAGAYRKLVSRGYASSVASRAVRTWMDSQRSEGD